MKIKTKYIKNNIFILALVICAILIMIIGFNFKKSQQTSPVRSEIIIDEETIDEDEGQQPVQESILVLTVDGSAIYMTEVNVRMYQLRDFYTGLYGESPWANILDDGRSVSQTAKDELYQSLIRTQLLCNKAVSYDLGLSEEEIQVCAQEAQTYIDELGPNICEQFNVTFDGVLAVNQKQLLAAKVYEHVISELGGDVDASEQIEKEQVEMFETIYQQWYQDCTITEMPAWQNVVIGSVG